MQYFKEIILNDGRKCILRNCTKEDCRDVLSVFILTHEETDNLLTYPDENTFTEEQEAEYLAKKAESENEIEILAEIDGVVAGTAGIDAVGGCFKVRHRAEFGVGIAKKYWGLGIGRAMTEACIECARKAGYEQLELNVVAENERAVSMYREAGFTEYGRNPRGFKSRISGFQEVVCMRIEL